ncbi:MAG: hypothetical protein ACRDU5_15820 [Mycobacterium sp.]
MSTTYETDASTIAAAWASSPLGDPVSGPTEVWETVEHAEAPPAAKPTSLARHAALVAALACGIGAGAAFGLAVFDFTDPAQSTVVPGADSTAPEYAVVVTPNHPAPAPMPVAPAAPPKHVEPTPVPKPVVTAPKPAQAAVPAPQGPVDPGTPPASHPPVIVDIDIPPLPPWPEQPDPEPPQPPPGEGPDDKAPKPKPKPKPDPPTLGPALPATVFAP